MSMTWLLVVGLAFFLAWNLGANDVANAMGTSVGSKVLTLRRAIVLAGILEFTGAVLFGQEVTATLASKVSPLHLFEGEPHLFVLSTIAQLLAISLWLFGATWGGWPVASTHAAVGAIAGVNALVFGLGALDWTTLRTIALCWVLTPLASGLVSAGAFTLLQRGILTQPQPAERWHHWQPWISVAVLGLFGGLILPTVLKPIVQVLEPYWHLPAHDYLLGAGFLGAWGLMHWTAPISAIGKPLEQQAERKQIERQQVEQQQVEQQQVEQQQVEQQQVEQQQVEQQIGKFQILSACCMALAHGSNDVGNAIAPLASFSQFWQTQTVPTAIVHIPLWVLGLGGTGIVLGLATWGNRVIATVGEKLLVLTPSYGFCAELGAATTILMASRWGLPLSTTHALIGSIVGIGLVQKEAFQWSTVRQIFTAWLITIPAAMTLGAGIFGILRALFPG
jgi:inorganic phosphate transporter, PiT family